MPVTKKTLDLAYSFGRKKQSPRTGFLHLFPSDENVSDTIPLYENFCFVFTLLSQKVAEVVIEGKQLLERLLCFQAPSGVFPVYLHEFPECRDGKMFLRIAPILVQIYRKFNSILGEALRVRIGNALRIGLQEVQEGFLSNLWKHRYQVLKELASTNDFQSINLVSTYDLASLHTADEWFEWIVTAQLQNLPIDQVPYDSAFQLLLVPDEVQEKGEPQSVAIEWALAEREGFGARLQKEHPQLLRAAILKPIELPQQLSIERVAWAQSRPFKAEIVPELSEDLCQGTCHPIPERRISSVRGGVLQNHKRIVSVSGIRWIWQGNMLHTLSAPGAFWEQERAVFSLQGLAGMQKGGEIETSLFCNLSSETEIFLSGKKGTVFSLSDFVTIQTPALTWRLSFEILEGFGEFVGQILRGNRPGQIGAKGVMRYEAFDWQIVLRTLRRSEHCKIGVVCAPMT